jgi:hypothetical protein
MPTPADLRALHNTPYGAAESKTAATIFREIRAHGPRTIVELVSTIGRRKRKSIENALKAAHERGHVVFEVVNRERVWSLGPEFGSIPIASVEDTGAEQTDDEPRTPVDEFWVREIRPTWMDKFDRNQTPRQIRRSPIYAGNYAVRKAVNWWGLVRPGEPLCVEEMDANWFAEFRGHLGSTYGKKNAATAHESHASNRWSTTLSGPSRGSFRRRIPTRSSPRICSGESPKVSFVTSRPGTLAVTLSPNLSESME